MWELVNVGREAVWGPETADSVGLTLSPEEVVTSCDMLI